MGGGTPTTLQSNAQSSSQSNRAVTVSSQSNSSTAVLSQSNSQSDRAAAMSSLQELFPTYGQGFLEACITCFDGQVNDNP